MAKYYTNTEELTSIANAIRAKGGTSADLVYPTGFVSAINNISAGSAYDWRGENLTLVKKVLDTGITLADTTFSSWTVSTTASIIYDTYDIETLTLDASYDYVIVSDGYCTIAYDTTPSNIGYQTEGYFTAITYVGRRPIDQSAFINENYNYISYFSGFPLTNQFYTTATGGQATTSGNYGFYFTTGSPAFTGQSSDTFTCTVRSPYVRVCAHNNAMNSGSFSSLNASNTTFHLIVTVYRIDGDNPLIATYTRLKQLYDLNNNIS